MSFFGINSNIERRNSIGRIAFLKWYDFYEMHESGVIEEEPKKIIEAVARLDMRDDKVARIMLSLRELPSKVVDLFRDNEDLAKNQPFGFDTFTLLKRNNNEIEMGLVGRFWRPDLVIQEVANANEFCMIDDEKMAKLLLRFKVIEHSATGSTLVTETFIYCPNTRTKILFTPYWLAIRFVSGWIRKRTLVSIQKKFQEKKM